MNKSNKVSECHKSVSFSFTFHIGTDVLINDMALPQTADSRCDVCQSSE